MYLRSFRSRSATEVKTPRGYDITFDLGEPDLDLV
jgi:hypothetical protein